MLSDESPVGLRKRPKLTIRQVLRFKLAWFAPEEMRHTRYAARTRSCFDSWWSHVEHTFKNYPWWLAAWYLLTADALLLDVEGWRLEYQGHKEETQDVILRAALLSRYWKASVSRHEREHYLGDRQRRRLVRGALKKANKPVPEVILL